MDKVLKLKKKKNNKNLSMVKRTSLVSRSLLWKFPLKMNRNRTEIKAKTNLRKDYCFSWRNWIWGQTKVKDKDHRRPRPHNGTSFTMSKEKWEKFILQKHCMRNVSFWFCRSFCTKVFWIRIIVTSFRLLTEKLTFCTFCTFT